MKIALLPLVLFAVLLTSCATTPESARVIVEASDLSPIGEAVKFLALALLGSVVVFCIASMINHQK